MTELVWRVEVLSKHLALDRSGFDCGDKAQNLWFHQVAGQAERKGVARTYLALDSDSKILGFYSLTGRSLGPEVSNSGTSARKYSLLYVELARLGVATDFQGKGLGRQLVADCFAKTLELDSLIGVEGVLVRPAKQSLAGYYQSLGLMPLDLPGGYLAISCKRIRTALHLYIPSTSKGE